MEYNLSGFDLSLFTDQHHSRPVRKKWDSIDVKYYRPKWRCVECGVDDFNKTNMDVGIDDLEVWCCHTIGNGVVNL